MKKLLILFLVFVLCFSGCGSDSPAEPGNSENPSAENGSSEIDGEIFNAGNVSALVPEGWMGFAVSDVFSDVEGAKDPDVIQICKNATSDWDIFTNPYVQINYYGPDTLMMEPSSDWYTDVKEIKSLKTGAHEWEGFTGYSDEYFFAILWCIEGDNEYQATMWLTTDSDSINYDDEDVKAILASVAPSDGSVPVGGTSGETENANPDEAIFAKYLGDWNGLLQIYDATGDYANLNNVVTGACARIVIDDNGELFPFIGLNLSGFYITSAYYNIDYDRETVIISGDYNSGSYENVEITEDNGTLTMIFPSIQPNGQFYFKINLRRIGDENWTTESPKFSQGDLDYVRGKTFEDIAGMMGYNSNHYPPAEMLNNGPAPSGSSGGNTASVSGEKAGADGIVSDYNTIKKALEFCKTERTYDTTYDEIAAQFGVHGFHVDDFDASGKTMRRYRWFYDDDNRVTITFEVQADGTETWNVTAWDGLKD